MLKFTCCDAVSQFSRRAQAQVLQGITRGFEKECLRVDQNGRRNWDFAESLPAAPIRYAQAARTTDAAARPTSAR